MPDSQNSVLNKLFMKLSRRSERVDRARLVDTFVDIGPLFTLISSNDHQIIFGRRGTGKTHVLNYLSDVRAREGDVVIDVDLSSIGSSGGIYADPNIPLPERATRLLVDTLLAVHNSLYDFFVKSDERFDLSRTGPLLDQFGDTITEVRVIGETSTSESSSIRRAYRNSSSSSVSASVTSLSVDVGSESGHEREDRAEGLVSRRGAERHSVHFGSARNTCVSSP